MLRLTRISRRFQAGLVVALLLSVSLVTTAMAHSLSNPDFGTHPTPGCSLSGWAVGSSGNGSVAALTESAAGVSTSSNCVAELKASLPGPSLAALSQSFHVPSVAGPVWLNLDLLLSSSGGAASSKAQFIGVYDAGGSPICTNWFNATTPWGSWSCDVTAYKASDIILRLRARVADNDDFKWSKVIADRVRYSDSNTCSANPDGDGDSKSQFSGRHGLQRAGFGDLDNGGKMCW